MSLRRSIIFAFLGRYSDTMIATVSTIVLARLLTPEEIGAFSIAAAAMAITGGLREFGLGNYLLQSKELPAERLSTIFWLGLLISIAMALLMVAFASVIASIYSDQRIQYLVYVLSIGFVVSPFSTPVLGRLKRELDFQ